MSGQDIANFLQSPLWQKSTLSEFQTLQADSEWASWAVYNDYYLNHFTVAVHRLTSFESLTDFNHFLTDLGLSLNKAGGTIKRSTDGLLEQSATVVNMIDGTFSDGQTAPISGSYAEHAYRHVLPEFREALAGVPAHEIPDVCRRDGFEVGNADKIFESTFRDQTC